MAEVGHVFKSDDTNKWTKTTSTWASPSNDFKFLGSELDASSDYVLIVHANVGGNDNTATHINIRMHDGTSALTGSEATMRPEASDNDYGYTYFWIGKITTPASSIPDYAFETSSNDSDTLSIMQFYGIALNLSDMNTSDYAYDEDTTNYNSITQNVDTASAAAVTVGDGSDDWAIFGCSHVLPAQTGRNQTFCMEGGTPSKVDPIQRNAGNISGEEICQGWVTFKSTPASNTYTAGFRSETATTCDVDHNAIFALNMSQFTSHFGSLDTGDTTISNANQLYEQATDSTTTPSGNTYDWCIIGAAYFNTGGTAGANPQARMTHEIAAGGETQTAGYVTDGRGYLMRGSNEWLNLFQAGEVTSVAASSTLDVDVDIREDTTVAGSPAGRDGVIIAFTWDGPDFGQGIPGKHGANRGILRGVGRGVG